MRTTSAARLAWDIQRPLRQQRCPGQARRAADGRSCRRSAVRMKPVTRIGKPRYLRYPPRRSAGPARGFGEPHKSKSSQIL